MGVASHLGIRLADYDRQIRTFIPDYDALLDAAAGVVSPRVRTILDLGMGTGTLAARCAARAPRAAVIGIDADGDILKLAAGRLPGATFVRGSFLRTPLPRADMILASFSLHHIRTREAKMRLYARVRAALPAGGTFVSVDCHPAAERTLAAAQFQAWREHLRRTYDARATTAYFRAWAREDSYTTLARELDILHRVGFRAEVVWRRGAFAVVQARQLRGR